MEKPILTKDRNVFLRAEINTEKKSYFSTLSFTIKRKKMKNYCFSYFKKRIS